MNRTTLGAFVALLITAGVANVTATEPTAHLGLTERQAATHCWAAVRSQLITPNSAQFGTYRATHESAVADWILTGGALADSAEGLTKPVTYRCNVQPFNGTTVATVEER